MTGFCLKGSRSILVGLLAFGCASCSPTSPSGGDYVIRNAYVMTMDSSVGDLPIADIHVRDGEIVGVQPNIHAPGTPELDARNMIALPGFVDTHFHLWSCILRASQESYFPLTLRLGPKYNDEHTYHATRLCAAEALLSGITTLHDWSHNVVSPAHANASIRALSETAIRGRFSYGWSQSLDPGELMDLSDIARLKSDIAANSPLISLGVAMRTPVEYQRGNVPLDVLIQEWTYARELGLPITIHNRPGVVSILAENDLLGPDVLLVHPQAFSAYEIERLKAFGVTISASVFGENRRGTNGPRGPVLLDEMINAEIATGLSVDEVVTNGRVDFFSVMREVPRIYMQRFQDEKSIRYRTVLELATIGGAKALGLESEIGTLIVGKRADIVLIRANDINIAPVPDNPSASLVLSAQPNNVDTVIVDGRVLVRAGRLTELDESELVQRAVEAAADLTSRDLAQTN